MTSTGSLRWFKSSYSDSGGGNCVEVAHQAPHTTHIRDSKHRDPETGPILTVSGAAWADFLTSL
ncbi:MULTISPECIES: DUF397 domain-containing protein [unclassified Streptomyces]|uniref:DUF397 domain-containing protein n=1 Tax=unclassified Streptomyces TaxID=2593676 RepID=UPI003D7594B5